MPSCPVLRPILLAICLGACAVPANDGFTRTRADALPFRQAHGECWAVAMNIGGMAQTTFQMNAYKQCMAAKGWEDRRTIFGASSS